MAKQFKTKIDYEFIKIYVCLYKSFFKIIKQFIGNYRIYSYIIA